MTETWLQENDKYTVKDLCPPGYKYIGIPRTGSRGGGTGFVYREAYDVKLCAKLDTNGLKFRSFECLPVTISNQYGEVLIFVIYRPPPSKKNKLTDTIFIDEFSEFIGKIAILPEKTLIIGDFNFHWDAPTKSSAKIFVDIIKSAGFIQHVNSATHRSGYILDLILSRPDEKLTTSCTVQHDEISDHFPVICNLDLEKPHKQPTYKKVRRYRNMESELFKRDLIKSLENNIDSEDPNEQVRGLWAALKSSIDTHAPVVTVKDKKRPLKQWYNEEINCARVVQRRLERWWRKSGLTIDKELLQMQRKKIVYMIKSAKSNFLKAEISKADSKKMYSLVNSLTGNEPQPWPTCSSNTELANIFCVFFNNKISKIRDELDSLPNGFSDSGVANTTTTSKLETFSLMEKKELRIAISKLKPKSCELDPCPGWLFKDYLETLLPSLLRIVNTSLQRGIVPSDFKHGLIRPLLKKSSLDSRISNNYRPVTNLPFVAKVLEKVVAKQLTKHMATHGLHDCLQSAYKSGCSTETALLKIKDYIQTAFDCNEGVLLVLLDI